MMKIKIIINNGYNIELRGDNYNVLDNMYYKAELISPTDPVYWDGYVYCLNLSLWYRPKYF